jgi:hypothetical protein
VNEERGRVDDGGHLIIVEHLAGKAQGTYSAADAR